MRRAPDLRIVRELGAAAGDFVVEAVRAAAEAHGRCRLGLSGGGTAEGLLDHLRNAMPAELYPALWITWVDERHLPVDRSGGHRGAGGYDRRSNVRLAWDRWLGAAPRNPACVLPPARGASLEEDRRAFEKAFADEFGGALDVAVLGAGPDGHVASLFPGRPELDAPGSVHAVRGAPKPPPERLTLGLSVLEAVDEAVLMASGAAKAGMLARAYAGDRSLPLGRLQPRGGWTWFLDPEAAAGLPIREEER